VVIGSRLGRSPAQPRAHQASGRSRATQGRSACWL